jgi:MFS family permease
LRDRRTVQPITFFFLVLPEGLSIGFISVTLPFLMTRAGFPVAQSASIVAIGLSANAWRFLWGPIIDATRSLRSWYVTGVVAATVTLAVLSVSPLTPTAAGLLTVLVFVSQVAATFVVIPVGGLMAQCVLDDEKGRAGGWYQAASLGGSSLGGGAGVWLASHTSVQIAGLTMVAVMAASATAIRAVPPLNRTADDPLTQRLRSIAMDFRDMLRSPRSVFAILLFVSPIGIGAAYILWTALAPDWRASADTVAWTNGLFGGLGSAIGCVAGGWIADRVGKWWAYFGSGALLGLVALVLALSPRTPAFYAGGTLGYAVTMGVAYAAFSALVLYVIGRGAAATKYAIMASLGNLPVAYMTAFEGWLHDRAGVVLMLHVEAAITALTILVGLAVLGRIEGRESGIGNRESGVAVSA